MIDTRVSAIDPNAIYTPREAASVSRVGLRGITAAIVTGDLRAKLKPPGNLHRIIIGADLLAWMNNALPDA